MKSLTAPSVQWFRSIWWADTRVALWFAILPDSSLHVRSELQSPKTLIRDFALAMRLNTKHLKLVEWRNSDGEMSTLVRYTVADKINLIGKTKPVDSGETRAETFRNHGISIRETSHDPIQGWTRITELLGGRPDGRPWLTIDPSCVGLIRSLTNAITDPTEPEAVLASANDQALHALRVGVMSRPAPKPLQKPKLPPNAIGHLVEELRSGDAIARRGFTWR